MLIERSDNMNKELFRDYLSAKIISENKLLDNYYKLYYRANENLVDIYLDLDFEDKDVLSVVSSSDQIFTPMLLGAKSVDGFDRNRLTKYYYYLRKWVIKYNREVYPMELLDGNSEYLSKLLNKVKVSSNEEADAYRFWNLLLSHGTSFDSLFYVDDKNKGETLFEDNVKYLQKLKFDDLNFNNYNFLNPINSEKKYDYILMSNIIEYCRGEDERYISVRDNLSNLLNDNGIVICSHLIHRAAGMDSKELEIFDDKFEYNDYGMDKGYTYIKKC